MKILAIETSCDETSAAVIGEENEHPVILSNIVLSQIEIHKKYGGVVPEVAARAHIKNIIPIIESSLKTAKTTINEIDFVAVTNGPGLIGSLLIGTETAKGIALANKIPFIPINHLEGHIYAGFAKKKDPPKFPILALIISGGHTLLILAEKHLDYKIIGTTRDDAAGEAFDKAAKIMGLGYPGGPIISELAKKGDKDAYDFPLVDLTSKPYRDENGYLKHPKPSMDFSFSGLKTSILTKVKDITKNKKKLTKKEICDLSASFQHAIIKNVTQNTLRAIKEYQPKAFILAGGVAANQSLRLALKDEIKATSPKTSFLAPELLMCTDNAAMIGVSAYYRVKLKKHTPKNQLTLSPNPSLKLGESV